jgi:hypothetical protein
MNKRLIGSVAVHGTVNSSKGQHDMFFSCSCCALSHVHTTVRKTETVFDF